jgi:hypothetical protein
VRAMMGRMSQPLRVIVASVLLATAALGLTVVASDIAITHYLPPGDSGVATKHIATFEPAIAGTVVASIAVIALLAHLIVVLRRRAARWMWLAAAVCTLLGVGAPVIVATLDRPVF